MEGRRCAFIDIGCPHVEGHNVQLKPDIDDYHAKAGNQQQGQLLKARRGRGFRQKVMVPALDQRHAEQQKGRGKGSQDEVFDACLVGALAGVEVGDVRVQRHTSISNPRIILFFPFEKQHDRSLTR